MRRLIKKRDVKAFLTRCPVGIKMNNGVETSTVESRGLMLSLPQGRQHECWSFWISCLFSITPQFCGSGSL